MKSHILHAGISLPIFYDCAFCSINVRMSFQIILTLVFTTLMYHRNAAFSHLFPSVTSVLHLSPRMSHMDNLPFFIKYLLYGTQYTGNCIFILSQSLNGHGQEPIPCNRCNIIPNQGNKCQIVRFFLSTPPYTDICLQEIMCH